jgi:hypothetical protein
MKIRDFGEGKTPFSSFLKLVKIGFSFRTLIKINEKII